MMVPFRRCAGFGMFALLTLVSTLGIGEARSTQVSTAVQNAATGPASPSTPSTATPTTADYRIGPEDVLEVVVWKNEPLTRLVVVRPDGRISLPLLNDVPAAGLTPLELRQALATGYARYVAEPEVSVIVRETHSFKISVVGLVKTPGRYELKSSATILEALALSGGVTDFAKRDRIFVLRVDGTNTIRIPFNYARLLDSGDENNFVLKAGDIIVVP